MMGGRGLLLFALLVTGGLTLILGRPAASERTLPELRPVVVSRAQTEAVISADTLGRGEVLAQVLARQSLTPEEMVGVVEAMRPYANPRRLRAGVAVEVQRTAWDSLLAISVRVDPDRQLLLRPEPDGWISELKEIAIAVDTVIVAGRIESSLYNSVMELRAPEIGPQERIERVMWGIYRPFQWSIDFGIDLRGGDTYRAIYERHVRPDGSVRDANVLAVEFVNRGRTHRAYWFDSRREYFDDEGGSMKRVFLKAPVDFRRISSNFARRRYHPKLGVYRAHLGTDYAANTGTRVYATADGTVTRAGWWGGYGRVVEIRHVNGYRTRYAHLSFIAKGIRAGIRVRQGQLIGHVGASGLATGPHLHYEMRQGDRALNPRNINFPSGDPVSSDHMAEFQRFRDRYDRILERASEPGVIRLAD